LSNKIFPIQRVLLYLSEKCDSWSNDLQSFSYRIGSRQKANLIDLEKSHWSGVRPCFVLSTGRCGTLLLNNLLTQSPSAFAVHHPTPELVRVSKRAFEEIESKPEIFIETFKSAREELVYQALAYNRTFIETNNRITFFAPIIKQVFPDAVFIHLVRHPADFVRSGIRRNWYSGKHDHDVGRIVPITGKMKGQWETLSQIEKIGWLWNETNQFIETFKKTLRSEDILFVKAEDLFSDLNVIKEIYSFLNLSGFRPKRISRLIKKPVNAQKKGAFPNYHEWDEKEKNVLRSIVPLTDCYGYQL